ncbi:hypothetical protein GGH99_004464, partial [Coemansia sp. RSA 1285]
NHASVPASPESQPAFVLPATAHSNSHGDPFDLSAAPPTLPQPYAASSFSSPSRSHPATRDGSIEPNEKS